MLEKGKLLNNEWNEENELIEKINKCINIENNIKTLIDKGKLLLNVEWNDENKLIERINDCINIEENIKNIIEINENINKCNSKKINIQFLPENEQDIELITNIKQFGEIIYNEDFKFKFKPGNNYNISNNGLIATKSGDSAWNCVIMGEKEIPKDKISKWKIKINKINKSL